MQDPVLLRLNDRRRNAQRLINRGTAIAERGKAELAECDRFEQFYREAKGNPGDRSFIVDPDAVELAHTNSVAAALGKPPNSLVEAMTARQLTLKRAIVDILKKHPVGLESGDLLKTLRANGFPYLLRTSMSPQLSRMKGKEVVNVEGRWTLTENKEAAPLL